MSNLTSGNPANANATTPTTMLTGAESYSLWLQNIRDFADTNGGLVGQNLFSASEPPLVYAKPGHPPSEMDERLNPMTQAPVPGSQKYPRESLTTADNCTQWDKPMTDAAANQFAKDTAAHTALTDKYTQQTRQHRAQDDVILNHIFSTIPPNVKSAIETHKDFSTFRALPADCYRRSKLYLAMVANIYSTGSLKLKINAVLKVLINPQASKPFSEFLATHTRNFTSVIQSIESPTYPGYISVDSLEFLSLHHNISPTSTNQQALNNYYLTYKQDMRPKELINELINQNIDEHDSHTDSTSQQGSALAATATALAAAPTAKHWGAKLKDRSDHCTTCERFTANQEKTVNGKLVKGPFYFYNHSSQNCKRQQNINAAKAAKALLASGGPPAAPATAAPAAPALPAASPNTTDLQLAIRSVLHSMCDDDSLSVLTRQH